MPDAPSSNSDTNYFNINQCRSFGMSLPATTLTRLSGTDNVKPWKGQPCSEVTIINSTGGILTLYDNNYLGPGFQLKIATAKEFTLRGLTNVNEISASAASAGPVYYRTQYFSSNPCR